MRPWASAGVVLRGGPRPLPARGCVGPATLPAMTTKRPTGQMSVVAELSGRSRDELYRLFRMEGSPNPVGHVSGVPVYDLEECLGWLQPAPQVDPEPSQPVRLAPPHV